MKNNKNRFISLISLIILFSFIPNPAFASKGNIKKAKRLFKAGQALFGAGAYKKAADKFIEAYKAKPIPAFLFNTAVCYEKSEQYEKAKKFFIEYIAKAHKIRNLAAIQARIRLLDKLIRYQKYKKAQKEAKKNKKNSKTVIVIKLNKNKTKDSKTDKNTKNQTKDSKVKPKDSKADKNTKNQTKDSKVKPKDSKNKNKDSKAGKNKDSKANKDNKTVILIKKPVLPPITTKNIITINTDPPGAAVYLGKKKELIGHTPYEGNIEPGKHILELQLPRHSPIKKVIEVPKNRVLELYFTMKKEREMAWIQVTSNIPGSLVFLDKKSVGPIGTTPYNGFVSPGKHTIYVAKDGFKEKKLEITPSVDKANSYHLKLENAPIAYVSFYGKKALNARVKLDKKLICVAPCLKVKVPAGKHKLYISKKGKKSVKKTINLKIREHQEFRVYMAKKPGKAGAVISYIMGFASLGGAIWMGAQSEKLKDDLTTDISSGDPVFSNDGRINKGKLFALGADVMYGVSALSFAVAIYKTFADTGKDSKITRNFTFGNTSVSVDPILLPEGSGVSLTFKY